MMRKIVFCLIIFVLPLILKAQSGANSVEFTFKLAAAARTSAGVYSDEGILIRTLWSNVEYKAGETKQVWDGLNDDGHLAPPAKYKVVVQSNNVKYEWEGARIGNTSTALTGPTKYRAFRQMVSMSITGNKAYFGSGYSEGLTSAFTFNLNSIGERSAILNNGKTNQDCHFVWSDDKHVYWAGVDPYSTGGDTHFIYATKVSDDTEVTDFDAGVKLKNVHGREYASAFDVFNSETGVYYGFTGMKNGDFLFAAQALENKIKVFRKYPSGELVKTITSFINPRFIAADMTNGLWIVHGTNTVEKYLINSDGSLSAKPIVSIKGLLQPLALAVSPDNKIIAICDGGTSEQVKAFSNTTGEAVWTLGEAGGYSKDPNVTNNKFYFWDRNRTSATLPFPTSFSTLRAFVTFAPDGSFWVMDPGNYRAQHYSKQRSFVERIMYLPRTYSVQADPNQPTKVFNQFMEFKIDYSKNLDGDNGSWELVRNYRSTVPNEYFESQMYNIFKSVITLKNGRTYGFLPNLKTKRPQLVELPVNAPLRFTGITFESNDNIHIRNNGDLAIYRRPASGPGGAARLYTRILQGFDSSGNPLWANESESYRIDPTVGTDPTDFGGGARQGQITTSGLIISFDRNGYQSSKKSGDGYHLGAVLPGSNKFLWKTSKSTHRSYSGDFPSDGSFDIGNLVNPNSAGGNVYVRDNQIFWNYQGEFWKNSQTNYWNHFSDKGLMIAQFGTHRESGGGQAPWGMAGNVMSGNVVKVGDDMYIYHCDEATHSGVHRWKVTGLNTIKEVSIPIVLTGGGHGLLGQYYHGTDLDNTNLAKTYVDSVINFNWKHLGPTGTDLVSTDNFSSSWTGFITPLISSDHTFYVKADDGVRLWIDGKLVIDKWQNQASVKEYSADIKLVANQRHAIRLEHYEHTGDASIALFWSYPGQAKVIVPSSQLFPANLASGSEGLNLMQNLPFQTILQNKMYGWSRGPSSEDNTDRYSKWWSVKTNVKSFTSPDVYIHYRQDPGSTYFVSRNLGKVKSPISGWSIVGNISFEGNFNNRSGGGGYIDVLDEADKIIARIYSSIEYGDTHVVSLYANRKVITKGLAENVNSILGQYQNLSVDMSENGLTVKYGPYEAVTTPVFDQASNWRKPKTLKFSFWTTDKKHNNDRKISVEGFRFKTQDGDNHGKIDKTDQSIDFPKVEPKTYGDSFTVKSTASSNLPVIFVVKSGPASVSGDRLTLTGTGTVVIEAHQNGNDKYNAANIVSQSFTVDKASQTISLGDISDKVVGDPIFSLIGTASSELPVAYKIKSGPAKLSDGKVTIAGTGTVVIEASQAGNQNFNPAPIVTKSFVVKQAEPAEKEKSNQTITFGSLPAKKATDEPFTLNATASSKLPITYNIKSGPATISGNKVTLTGAGTVIIAAYQSGNDKFNPASSSSQSFTVSKATQTLTMGDLPEKKENDPAFSLNGVASSGLPVSYRIKSGPAKLSGGLVSLTGVGKVIVEISQGGNERYSVAQTITKSFEVKEAKTEITKSDQTISFADLTARKATDAPFTLTATASSKLPVTYSVKSGPATISGNKVTLTGGGTVVIEASQSGDSKFNAASTVSRNFTVSKVSQTITFANLSVKQATDAPFTLAATASSKLSVTYRVKSGPATILGNKVTLTGGGTVVIEASQSGDSKFNAASTVSKSFTVNKVSQTITFAKIGDKKATDAPFSLTATASSKLPMSYRIKSGPAKISGSTLTITGSGSVIIEANQSGNSFYNAASTSVQTLVIAAVSNPVAKKLNQTITFPDKIGMTENLASVTLMATASSGLTVNYRIKSGPATVAGNKVTIKNIGAVVVEAYQSGDDKFNAATPVSRSFNVGSSPTTTVVKLDQTISFSAIGTRYKKDQFTLDASASSGLAVSYRIISGPASLTGSKITVLDAGTVVVEASQSGDARYNKAASVSQTFKVSSTSQKAGVDNDSFFDGSTQRLEGDAEVNQPKFEAKLYPNPASSYTIVEFTLESDSEVNLEIFNLQGMLIKRIPLGLNLTRAQNTYKLDTENLPAGVYIVRILTSNDVLSKRLLIVK